MEITKKGDFICKISMIMMFNLPEIMEITDTTKLWYLENSVVLVNKIVTVNIVVMFGTYYIKCNRD